MLQSLADEQRLCYGLLGLEPLSRGRACFRSALGRCAGACCGKEAWRRTERLLAQMSRLQLVCWPWAGPVALEERGGLTQYHVIHNWLWLGAVESLDRAAELTRLPAGFDGMVTRSSVSLCSAETIRCIRLAEKPPIKTAGPAQRLMALLGKTGGLDSVRYIIQQVQAFYLPARCVLSDASQN